jgi:hypothetical protein
MTFILPTYVLQRKLSRVPSSRYPGEKDLSKNLLFQRKFPTNPLDAIDETAASSNLTSFSCMVLIIAVKSK